MGPLGLAEDASTTLSSRLTCHIGPVSRAGALPFSRWRVSQSAIQSLTTGPPEAFGTEAALVVCPDGGVIGRLGQYKATLPAS